MQVKVRFTKSSVDDGRLCDVVLRFQEGILEWFYMSGIALYADNDHKIKVSLPPWLTYADAKQAKTRNECLEDTIIQHFAKYLEGELIARNGGSPLVNNVRLVDGTLRLILDIPVPL